MHSKGGGLFEIQDPPPPPSRPPKFSNPSFSNFRFRGKLLAPKAPNFFFFTLCVYTQNTHNFVENSKVGEKRKKYF